MTKSIDLLVADNIRALSVAMVEKANSGHPGGPMGGADFMHILYSEYLNYDPTDMKWPFRDRFFMDAGHLSALMYAQYYLLGNFSKGDIEQFRQWGSSTPGHPEVDVERGIENTSGPLGQGHAMGVGSAIAAKFLDARFPGVFNHKIYGFISDGGIQEEISQGVGRIAGHLGLDNFIMFYDSNDIQLSSSTEDVSSEDTAKKYESWGWKVLSIDAHNHQEIRNALDEALKEVKKPVLIIGKTRIGRGCVTKDGTPYEGKCELHGKPIGSTKADYHKTLQNLGADPDTPFEVYELVRQHYDKVLANKKKIAEKKREKISKWEKTNPDLAKKMRFFLENTPSNLSLKEIVHKPHISTRESSGNVLAYLAKHLENMIVSSADLSNSDKTDGFLNESSILRKDDFSGAFLQSGVSELTMAALANGMALHGGVIPVVATFFVFSDYMKPAVRLSAIQQLPVKYVWTHDSFRVGEDGPTHQPIEQEAQIRLLEKVKNHAGNQSLIAFRPADSYETTAAWEIAIENTQTPTALILSRQNTNDVTTIPAENNAQIKKGGYLIKSTENPSITLVANGSEVGTLLEATVVLEGQGIEVNVASIISQGLFSNQPKSYKDSVILPNIPVFGLTAGLPIVLEELVGVDGQVFGLEHFGYSAPAKVLDDKFGFTGEQVAERIKRYLKKS